MPEPVQKWAYITHDMKSVRQQAVHMEDMYRNKVVPESEARLKEAQDQLVRFQAQIAEIDLLAAHLGIVVVQEPAPDQTRTMAQLESGE